MHLKIGRDIKSLKQLFAPLKNTMLHPQWLSYRGKGVLVQWLRQIQPSETVLDIGCANRWTESYLPASCHYVGLDYIATATERYNSTVDVYATATSLPLKDCSVDTVIMFDVLEHIASSSMALSEVSRVLRPGGKVLVQIPYLYPIHDAPYDYRRLTSFGLEELARQNHLNIQSMGYRGQPLETAILLTNIALVKTTLELSERHPSIRIIGYLLVGILTTTLNCFGWAASTVLPKDGMMPFSYHYVMLK